MTKEEREELQNKLEWEGGLDYLVDGTDCEWIKDKEFHKLRGAYVKASRALSDYIFEED